MKAISAFLLSFICAASCAQTASIVKSETADYNDLMKYINTLKVIDAHEHILSAEDHAKQYLCFYNFLSDYVKWDMYGAGMPKKYMDYKPKNDSCSIFYMSNFPFLNSENCPIVCFGLARLYGGRLLTCPTFRRAFECVEVPMRIQTCRAPLLPLSLFNLM